MLRLGVFGLVLICAMTALLPVPVRADADNSNALHIVDDAGLFTPDALARAGRITRQIEQADGREVYVRVFPEIPAAKQAAFRTQDKDEFYGSWQRELAGQAHVNGVFILIVKQPGRVQIGVGSKTRQHIFTDADRDQARDIMLGHFREKRYDLGLVQGLQFIFQRMSENEHPQARQAIVAALSTQPTTLPATNPAGNSGDKTTAEGDFK